MYSISIAQLVFIDQPTVYTISIHKCRKCVHKAKAVWENRLVLVGLVCSLICWRLGQLAPMGVRPGHHPQTPRVPFT